MKTGTSFTFRFPLTSFRIPDYERDAANGGSVACGLSRWRQYAKPSFALGRVKFPENLPGNCPGWFRSVLTVSIGCEITRTPTKVGQSEGHLQDAPGFLRPDSSSWTYRAIRMRQRCC